MNYRKHEMKAMTVLRRLIAGLIALLIAASCALALADQVPVRPASVSGKVEELYGRWHGGGKAANAIYGRMNISETGITWKGNNNVDPRCTVSYQRIHESHGVRFRDLQDNSYVTAPNNNQHTTFLLKINGGKCALGITHFRFTLDRELPGYIDMIEYEGMPNTVGRMHFYRD